MGEHLLCKQGVGGSNPLASTRRREAGRQMSGIRCQKHFLIPDLRHLTSNLWSGSRSKGLGMAAIGSGVEVLSSDIRSLSSGCLTQLFDPVV